MIPTYCPCGEQLIDGTCQTCRAKPLYVQLAECQRVAETREVVAGNVFVDYDAKGNAVGVEVLEGTVRE